MGIKFKEGEVYLFRFIQYPDWHYEGTFVQYKMTYSYKMVPVFRKIICCYKIDRGAKYDKYSDSNYRFIDCHKVDNDTQLGIFGLDENYKYYDAKKVKNGQNAINNMEKRAVNMILKRLINENFEW
jgi:hypothetical protein